MYLIKSWSPNEIQAAAASEEFIELCSHDPLEQPHESVSEFCAAASEFGAYIDYDEGTVTNLTRDILLQQMNHKFDRVFDVVRIVPSTKAHSLLFITGDWINVSFVWAEPEERCVEGRTVLLDRHFAWLWYSTA